MPKQNAKACFVWALYRVESWGVEKYWHWHWLGMGLALIVPVARGIGDPGKKA